MRITIEAPSLTLTEAQHLVRTTQHALDDLNEFSAHHLRLRLGSSLGYPNASLVSGDTPSFDQRQTISGGYGRGEETALTVHLEPKEGLVAAAADLQPYSTTLNVPYVPSQVPSVSSSSSALADVIANKLQDIFAEEQATIAYILTSTHALGNTQQNLAGLGQVPQIQSASSGFRGQRSGPRTLNPDLASRLARRMTRSLKYAATYHITISLFTPTASPSSWEIESAVNEYLQPLLDSFSGISDFTVDTQVQHYASFSPSVQQPEYDSDFGVWTLRKEDLSGFINAAEWPLSPSIGAGPTLNFVLYVPQSSMAPLVVKESRASSWLIPQWGGVVILNPSNADVQPLTVSDSLTKDEIRPALLTFSHQLLSLLGTPQSPPSLPLQLQTLTRVQAASLLLSASSTMGSLARLTVALPSIAIPETVANVVNRTLSHLHDACTSLRDGQFHLALEHARIAESYAEKGFFEKSMVGQVYFPDEHKVAVYLPLLGPIAVPLVSGALKEIKRLWSSRTRRD